MCAIVAEVLEWFAIDFAGLARCGHIITNNRNSIIGAAGITNTVRINDADNRLHKTTNNTTLVLDNHIET